MDTLKQLLEAKPHGLDPDHLPNDEWLINTIKTLDPENEIFQFIKVDNEEEE